MVKQGSTPGAKIWQVSAPSPTRETLTPIERGPGMPTGVALFLSAQRQPCFAGFVSRSAWDVPVFVARSAFLSLRTGILASCNSQAAR